MPEAAGITGRLTITDNGVTAAVPGHITITNAAINAIEGTLEIDPTVAAAGVAPALRAGVTVWVDLGSGVLTAIPLSDLADDVVITESDEAGQYADTATFSRVGPNWSPFMLSLIRAKRPMRIDYTYGPIGGETTQTIFTGFFTKSSWQSDPPQAFITCMDQAIEYANKKVAIDEPANHGKTRLQILKQLADEHDMMLGTIDLGPRGSVPLSKPISRAEVGLVEFLAEILAPCGARVHFEETRFCATRFSTTEPIVRALNLVDISPGVTADIPDVAVPNTITAIAVHFESTPPSGYRTVTTEEETRGFYAVKGAVLERTTSGVETAVDLSDPLAFIVTKRIIRRDTYFGETIVRSEIDEWGWYSPLGAASQIETDDEIVNYNGALRYQYADGTWHREPKEKFRVIRRTINVKNFDPDTLRVTSDVEQTYQWHFVRKAIWQVNISGGEDFNGVNPIPLTPDGEGLKYAYEIIGAPEASFGGGSEGPFAERTTVYDADEQGFLDSTTATEYFWSAGEEIFKANNAYVYGAQTKRYRPLQTEEWNGGERIIETRYDVTSEDTYRILETTTIKGGRISGGDDVTVRTLQQGGARPTVETIREESSSQEQRVTATDEVRVYLNGEQVSQIQNEWCESKEDLRVLADAAIREASAWLMTIPMPLEGIIHKARYVTLHQPTIGPFGERVRISGVQRQLASFTQTLTAKYYPAEVRDE